MQTIRWKRGKVITIVVTAILLYICLKPRQYEYSNSVLLPKTKPIDVWEFVADFSNMKYLNPTIIDFQILSEKGNYDHWQYVIEYTENLSHWPYLKNIAIAHISVLSDKKDQYIIRSNHTTCIVTGIFCLNSTGEFKFTKGSDTTQSTICVESIQYECPLAFRNFCRREVEFQRTEIMKNLKLYFNR